MSDQNESLVLTEEERRMVLAYRRALAEGPESDKHFPEMTPAMRALCDRAKTRVISLLTKLAGMQNWPEVYAIGLGATEAGMTLIWSRNPKNSGSGWAQS